MSTIPGKYLTAQTGNRFGDYQHGRRLFADNNNELVPKFSFLYHVFFELNSINTNTADQAMIGMLAKSVDLPKFTIQTKDLIAYNQHVTVQTGIRYDPVTIQFHDDSADVVRAFWYNYMTYYYGDAYNAKQDYHTFQENRYQSRKSQQFGYSPMYMENTRFLNSVQFYSMSKGYYSKYTLVNPTIDSWHHGEHRAGQNEFLGHTMRLKYETVLYDSGEVMDDGVKGFGEDHYDKTPKGIGVNLPAPGVRGLAAAPGSQSLQKGYVLDKATGLPRRPLLGGLVDRLGRLAVNTAIGAANNRLRNTKFGNGYGGLIASSAANAAFGGVTSAVVNKSNQFFPSFGKTFIPAGTSSADITTQGVSINNQG